MKLQWIVTDYGDGKPQEYLITYYESSDEYIEVAPRIDGTRWGPPLPCKPIYDEEDAT